MPLMKRVIYVNHYLYASAQCSAGFDAFCLFYGYFFYIIFFLLVPLLLHGLPQTSTMPLLHRTQPTTTPSTGPFDRRNYHKTDVDEHGEPKFVPLYKSCNVNRIPPHLMLSYRNISVVSRVNGGGRYQGGKRGGEGVGDDISNQALLLSFRHRL